VEVNQHKIYRLNDKIDLTHLENNISINVSGLSFLSGGDITYRYKIVELNDAFLTTKNNAINYNELQPGIYHFMIEAVDVFGNKSNTSAQFTFEVKPAWYQTFIFKFFIYTFLILMLIGFVYFFTKQKLDKKRKEEDLKQLISKLELEAIRSQINPHFIFNCLNAIQNSIFKGEYEQASHYINRFAVLMRKTLELSKESYISIEEESEFIKNYMDVEKYRMNDKFDYSIIVDSQLDKMNAIIPAFILQPFIENSINHGIKYLKGEKGLIVLSFEKVSNQLIITIDDNGIGLNASKEIQRNSSSKHSSQGMDLIRRRAETLNNLYDKNITIEIKDKSDIRINERGTRTVITLNLNND
jgi:LytS/YehU family sensor histidine kinase